MIYMIPVQENVFPFSQQVELDGIIFDLSFRWNARDSHWFMTVLRDNTALVNNVKLVNTENLLLQYQRAVGLPEGRLFIFDRDGLGRDPDSVNFGDRVVLAYEEVSNV